MKPSFILRIFDDCIINTTDSHLVCLINPNDGSVLDYFDSRNEAWNFFDKWCERHLNSGWVDDPICLQSSLCKGI